MGVGLQRTSGNGSVFHGVYFTLYSVWSCDQEVVYIGTLSFFSKMEVTGNIKYEKI